MKKYRSAISAYRDGYRITNIKKYDSYSIVTLERKTSETEPHTVIIEESNSRLEKFFGEAKLKLLEMTLEHESVK